MKPSFHIVVLGLTLLSPATCAWACDGYPVATAASHRSEAKDIVDTAVSARQFKTLTAALKAAGLVDTLKSKGPFTVFAPTDAAFAKLPAGTVEALLKPENKAKLTAILTYHVAAGNLFAKDVARLSDVKTVQGSSAKIKVDDGKVMVDGAKVLKVDIVCGNGVIHVIDTVILPK
jgi:transforming growth factor-beta-induced protein